MKANLKARITCWKDAGKQWKTVDRLSIQMLISRTVFTVFQTTDTYDLKVLGRDLNGRPDGNTGTGVIRVKVTDVNDNVPTLEKEQVALFDTRPTVHIYSLVVALHTRQ